MNKHDMLLANGKVVEFNLQDALEVLTETEAVILDMLVAKVQDHTEEKAKEVAKQQTESAVNANQIVHLLAQKLGVSPLDIVLRDPKEISFVSQLLAEQLQKEQPKQEAEISGEKFFQPFIFTEYIPQKQ